jgi:hypothetical protein
MTFKDMLIGYAVGAAIVVVTLGITVLICEVLR